MVSLQGAYPRSAETEPHELLGLQTSLCLPKRCPIPVFTAAMPEKMFVYL